MAKELSRISRNKTSIKAGYRIRGVPYFASNTLYIGVAKEFVYTWRHCNARPTCHSPFTKSSHGCHPRAHTVVAGLHRLLRTLDVCVCEGRGGGAWGSRCARIPLMTCFDVALRDGNQTQTIAWIHAKIMYICLTKNLLSECRGIRGIVLELKSHKRQVASLILLV